MPEARLKKTRNLYPELNRPSLAVILAKIQEQLIADQVELPVEAMRVLNENRWEIYE